MQFLTSYPGFCIAWLISNLIVSFPVMGMATYLFFVGYLIYVAHLFIKQIVFEGKETPSLPIIIIFTIGLIGSFPPFLYWRYLLEGFGLEILKPLSVDKFQWQPVGLLISIASFQLINALCCLPALWKLVPRNKLWAIFVISQVPSNLALGMYWISLKEDFISYTYGFELFTTPILTVATWVYMAWLGKQIIKNQNPGENRSSSPTG
jgi:hypothetical protein